MQTRILIVSLHKGPSPGRRHVKFKLIHRASRPIVACCRNLLEQDGGLIRIAMRFGHS